MKLREELGSANKLVGTLNHLIADLSTRLDILNATVDWIVEETEEGHGDSEMTPSQNTALLGYYSTAFMDMEYTVDNLRKAYDDLRSLKSGMLYAVRDNITDKIMDEHRKEEE